MRPSITIVTGLSGSGKTVALRAMEDAGYICVDNLPPQLIDVLARTISERGSIARVAVGVDVREKDSLHVIARDLPALRAKYAVEVLFLEAEADVLVRRFKETRRPHPLVTPERPDVEDAIAQEKGLLLPLREVAGRIIDTSPFNPHELRQHIISLYGRAGGEGEGLDVTLMSFGFKFGVPRSVDLLFDVRFLPNPHFVPELKDLKGTDPPVSGFVLQKPQTGEFLEKLTGMLEFLIPLYEKEGKSYLTVGVGCTGGRHRSAAIVEETARRMRALGLRVRVVHRDL